MFVSETARYARQVWTQARKRWAPTAPKFFGTKGTQPSASKLIIEENSRTLGSSQIVDDLMAKVHTMTRAAVRNRNPTAETTNFALTVLVIEFFSITY